MPTYSYKCTACGNAFDTVQSFSDPALTTCEVCGGTLRKVFSPVGVTFNGSGFYRTDSRSKPGGDAGKTSGKSDSGSGKSESGSGKSDSGSGKSDSGSGTSGSGSSSSGSSSSAAASTGAAS
jgi:putative FmdB family regulatory protein